MSDDRVYLRDIVERINRIEAYTRGGRETRENGKKATEKRATESALAKHKRLEN